MDGEPDGETDGNIDGELMEIRMEISSEISTIVEELRRQDMACAYCGRRLLLGVRDYRKPAKSNGRNPQRGGSMPSSYQYRSGNGSRPSPSVPVAPEEVVKVRVLECGECGEGGIRMLPLPKGWTYLSAKVGALDPDVECALGHFNNWAWRRTGRLLSTRCFAITSGYPPASCDLKGPSEGEQSGFMDGTKRNMPKYASKVAVIEALAEVSGFGRRWCALHQAANEVPENSWACLCAAASVSELVAATGLSVGVVQGVLARSTKTRDVLKSTGEVVLDYLRGIHGFSYRLGPRGVAGLIAMNPELYKDQFFGGAPNEPSVG